MANVTATPMAGQVMNLERLNINPDHYLRFINRTKKSRFHNFIGAVDAMRAVAERLGRTILRGQTAAAQLFSPG